MTVQEIIQHFVTGMKNTGWLEYIAVFAGIASVWYSRKEKYLGISHRIDQHDHLYLSQL
jgi:nicotinamide mononucleotide transporter